jgi:serine/threonine protein kinase
VNPINKAMSFCGSPAYLAPELLSKTGSEKSADVYGMGAILYEMLSGLPPFYSDNLKELFKNIKRAMLQFPKIIRNDAQDLIRQLMNKDPNKRIKLNSAKQHVFFKEINWEELEMKKVKPPRLGPKWIQMDDFSEEISNYAANKNVDDEDYVVENSIDKVADFNFSRISVNYLGK